MWLPLSVGQDKRHPETRCLWRFLASKITGTFDSRPETFDVGSKQEHGYGKDGKGSPELLAKRTEARRIREEASAAIEAELAKDEYC
jgi:hypothetical protein